MSRDYHKSDQSTLSLNKAWWNIFWAGFLIIKTRHWVLDQHLIAVENTGINWIVLALNQHPVLITQKELFHNLGKLFLAYRHKPSIVSLIISLNTICMQFSTRPNNSYLNFCFNSFGAKKQPIAIFEEQSI